MFHISFVFAEIAFSSHLIGEREFGRALLRGRRGDHEVALDRGPVALVGAAAARVAVDVVQRVAVVDGQLHRFLGRPAAPEKDRMQSEGCSKNQNFPGGRALFREECTNPRSICELYRVCLQI